MSRRDEEELMNAQREIIQNRNNNKSKEDTDKEEHTDKEDDTEED